MMKKIVLLALMLTPLGLCAQTRQAADAAYEAGRFQEALNYYRQEAKTAGGDALYEAQLRAVACQFMLGQYMNAAKDIFSTPLPSHPVWKARFLLYRIQTAQRVKNIYSPALPNASEDAADFSNLSSEQWKDKINETFEQLWALRADLINAPLEKETLILEIKDADLKAVPTLFDFVTLTWKEYLTEQSFTAVPLRAKTALTLEYSSASKAANNVQKLLDILAEAAKLGGKNRADARLIWQAQRIMLPFEHREFFTFEDKTAEQAEAARLLQTLAGYIESKKGILAKISRLLPAANADYGKSYAAYAAAGLLNQNEEYAQAVALCDWAQTKLGDNYYTQSCARLAQEIRKPVLEVTSPTANQDPADTRVSFTVRNAPEAFARLYPVTEKDLKTWYKTNSSYIHNWNYLTEIPGEEIPQLLKRMPLATLNQAVSYAKPHAFETMEFKLPRLEQRGFYVLLLSMNREFNPEKSPIQAVVLNNTDLALFVSAAIEGDPAEYHTAQNKTFYPNVFRIYALNLKTGEPETNADVTYFTDWQGHTEQGKTNEKGILPVKRKISTNLRASNHYSIMPKAVSGAGTALIDTTADFHFYPQDPVRLFAETDRAVYRPGQKVQFAVYGFERAGRGLKTLPENAKVSVTLRDANYEKIYDKPLPLNAYGTARGEVTLPETGLLGNYRVEAVFKSASRTTRANTSFRVDEYKRPEYEISLSPAAALQYGKEAKIEGKALYYFGAPLEKANVKYTIHREYFRPRWWWWMPYVNAEREFISQGETQTDKNGVFSFSFTPQNTKGKDLPSVYTVHAEVADASGRVIETTRTYKAADKAVFFQASFDKGFYDAQTAGPLAEVKLTDVNGEAAAGKFTAEIYELENVLNEKEQEETGYEAPPYLEYSSFSLEHLYGDNKEIRKVSSREFSLKKAESARLEIAALPEGIYKLKLRAKNADQTELIFLVTEKKSSLALPSVAIAQYEKYYPGTQAKVLIGAKALNGAKQIEVYEDGQFLALKERISSGAEVYSLPIQNNWRGGVYLRWFGASDYRIHSEETYIEVPFDNKELSLQIQIPESVKPGEKVQWSLSAKNAAGAPVQGQASVRIYDKSLDYYAKPRTAFTLDNLYPYPSLKASITTRAHDRRITSVYPDEDMYVFDSEEKPQMPRLNLQPHFYRYNIVRSAGAMDYGAPAMATMKAAAPRAAKQAAVEEAAFDTDDAASIERSAVEGEILGATDSRNESDEKEIRFDFSETAYFNPTLPIQGGKGTLAFTMPQSLTAWNVMAFALTKTADFGEFEAQTVTQKDLSVRLSLPRFWREEDASVLVAQVSNLTDKKLTAEVTLDLTFNGKDAAERFGVEKTTQKVSVPAAGTAVLNWPVSVPSGVGVLKAAVTVRSGKEADAEVREIPILPAKERLAESVTAALESGRTELKLENLLTDDPTREVSSVTLRVDPGLLLGVFNAMPQLLRPVYNDALSVAAGYIPLAVVNGFYKTYPMLQDAVAKLPKRNTRTPVWNDNTDPSRLLLLEETPWLRQARGGAGREAFLTDLFNPSDVEKARQKAEKDLAKYQTASGGYSWMPGGKPSAYITLSLLSAYAEALRYGGQIPTEAAKKALKWLSPVIEKDLLDAQDSYASVSFALYAAYVFTAFDQKWPEVKSAPVKKWLDYADSHSQYMTPLGQTYAAAAYHRLGENTKAQNYLDLVLSQMKSNPVTGTYFAPEELSWLWYNDTLRTQTATLRTLMEIRPESDKAAELVKWLLFNRKAQEWDSSSATADAVYALLDYMQRKGLLDDPAEYTLQWGGNSKTLHFEPFDWSEQLSWTMEAQNVPEKYYTASAAKRGGLTGFVTLDAVYTTANAKASPKGVLNVQRQYFLKYTENGREKVRLLQPQEELPAGSEVEVRLTIQADSAFDYVLLQDPKPAGFENTDLLSGWSWNILPVYRQYRDASTQFFIDSVPAGKYTLSYTLRPTLEGTYHALPAQLQSMYSPQFSAHTDAARLNVR